MLHLTWTVFTVIYKKVPGVGPRKGSIHTAENVSKLPVDMFLQELANLTVSVYVAKHPLSLKNSVGHCSNTGQCDSFDNENKRHHCFVFFSWWHVFSLAHCAAPRYNARVGFLFITCRTLFVARILTTQVQLLIIFFFYSTCRAFIVMFARQYSGTELRKAPERLVEHVELYVTRRCPTLGQHVVAACWGHVSWHLLVLQCNTTADSTLLTRLRIVLTHLFPSVNRHSPAAKTDASAQSSGNRHKAHNTCVKAHYGTDIVTWF